MTSFWPNYIKNANKALKEAHVVQFTCFYCTGKIKLNTEESQKARAGRCRKKCNVCGEWLSFTFEGRDVHDIKGESLD